MFHSFKIRCVAGLLAGLACLASPALEQSADAAVIDIRIAPPVARVESRPPPPPHRHFVWVDGYWGWNGHRHVWVPGRYVPARRGYAWRQSRWEQTRHGHWRLHEGRWYRN